MIYDARLYANDHTDKWDEELGTNYGCKRVLIVADTEETAVTKAERHWANDLSIMYVANGEPGIGLVPLEDIEAIIV